MQYFLYAASPIFTPILSQSAASHASSTCTRKPAFAIASYSTRSASASANTNSSSLA